MILLGLGDSSATGTESKDQSSRQGAPLGARSPVLERSTAKRSTASAVIGCSASAVGVGLAK